jgi:isopenicillin N synthase-like dioxygenase
MNPFPAINHYLLRVLHYPPLDGTENADALQAAAHEDINLITIPAGL